MVFASIPGDTLGGFPKEMYLAYALWAMFMGRAASNWMYEFRMMKEIETGTINGVLIRPMGFFEYYLSQFLGYKWMSLFATIWLPLSVCTFFGLPSDPLRVPLALLLVAYYMVFVYTLSFTFVSFTFFYNRMSSLTVGKNFILWILVGELFPLDLAPEPFKSILILLPPASGVYLPVGYITGRVGMTEVLNGFLSVTIGILVMGFFATIIWNRGRRIYSGTGA